MNAMAAEFFQYILAKSKYGKKALEYLENRGIKTAIMVKFKLGYSPDSWDSLRMFLKKKGYTDEEMAENGLLVRSASGRYYDRFRGRVMFPIADARDHILGFSGRILEGEKEAKYLNTPETPVYHKRETLYGINLARESIKKEKNAYLVEGEFDMITPYAHGLTNFVAIKGSALTLDQIMLLKRFTPKLTFIFDSDSAGSEAAKRGIAEAEKLELELEVVRPDFAKDPDEAVRKDEAAFKKILKNPQPIYDFLISTAIQKYSADDPFGKKKIADEVLPFVERIGNPIVKSHYTRKLAGLLGVTESSIEILMARIKRQKKPTDLHRISASSSPGLSREAVLEKYVFSRILQSENPKKRADSVFAIISPSDLSIPSHQKIMELFFEEIKKNNSFETERFASTMPDPLKPVFDEIYLFASAPTGLEEDDISKLSFEIKRFSLKRQIRGILEGEGDDADRNKKLVEISAALKEVEKKLVSL